MAVRIRKIYFWLLSLGLRQYMICRIVGDNLRWKRCGIANLLHLPATPVEPIKLPVQNEVSSHRMKRRAPSNLHHGSVISPYSIHGDIWRNYGLCVNKHQYVMIKGFIILCLPIITLITSKFHLPRFGVVNVRIAGSLNPTSFTA